MIKFGLIGYPIAHSLSPSLFRKAYDGRWDYDLLEYEDFDAAWKAFLEGPYRAVNITAPFKARAAAACDVRSREVLACDAANIAVKRDDGLYAYNSDVLALRHLLTIQHPLAAGASPLSTSPITSTPTEAAPDVPSPLSSPTRGRTAISSSPCGFHVYEPVPSPLHASPDRVPAADVAVIGSGGAGRAALAAAQSLGLTTRLYHHDELTQGPIEADTIVFTLPKAVPGLENLHCECLIEANYKDPCCTSLPEAGHIASSHITLPHFTHYISGTEWLRLQATLGYALMTGLEPLPL